MNTIILKSSPIKFVAYTGQKVPYIVPKDTMLSRSKSFSTALWTILIIVYAEIYIYDYQSIDNERYIWSITFRDEFNEAKLDTTKWNTLPRWGRIDTKGRELQYYADDAFEIVGGILRIKAEKCEIESKNYSSGLIESSYKFSQAYGKFEVRARPPKGQGLWSGFWLVPEKTWPPEIDVFEYIGQHYKTLYTSQHWINRDGINKHITNPYSSIDLSQTFHTYAVIWEPSQIIWYLDGVERFRSTENIPSEPMYLTANLAVGGSWPGRPNASTPFPSYLDIDYIRVYEQVNLLSRGESLQ